MKTVSINIDEPLLRAIDKVAKVSKRTRSDICRLALRKWLEAEREAAMVKEEQEAYLAHPMTSDEFGDLIDAQSIHEDEEERS